VSDAPGPDRSRDGELVCYCIGVRRGQLLDCILERDARTVEDLTRLTAACTGCHTCYFDLQDLLEECAGRRSKAEG